MRHSLLLSIMPSAEELIISGGLLLIVALIFIETAFLIGIVAPGGDTLLFTTGLLCGSDVLQVSPEALLLILTLAAYSGDLVGFWLGRKMRSTLQQHQDTWYLKRHHLRLAGRFYRKRGALAVVFGKFLPIIRSLIPPMAAVSGMPYGRFAGLALAGSTIWIGVFVAGGIFLGSQIPGIKNYIHFLLPAVMIIVFIPIIISYLKRRRHKRQRR